MGLFRSNSRRLGAQAFSAAFALAFAVPLMMAHPAVAGSGDPANQVLKKMKAGAGSNVKVTTNSPGGFGNDDDDGAPTALTNWSHAGAGGGKATTLTQVVTDGTAAPFLAADSSSAMQALESHYASIVSSGGWGSVSGSRLKLGSTGKSVAALNRRLSIEGYLGADAGGDTFTAATAEAVKRFQRNNGLFVTGATDAATVAALNVSADKRLAVIRANLPRVAEYSKDLGPRYVVVNVPAQQIEAIENGRVYSIHNAIVGRPSRPTPVVETHLVTVKFNPYWNAPASIVERDLVPRMLSTGASRVLDSMNIKVFDGVGGPEVDPDTIDWRSAVVDNYHFRQEPGGSNAMATAKIEFNSPFGIYLHDTPEPQLFSTNDRFFSSGCVRVEKVAILINWILNGQDGINPARISQLAQTKERLDEQIANPPQLRVAYLTAWPAGGNVAAFRNDVYQLDGTGFVTGQPLPVGESMNGQRFVLKPVPRTPTAVDADEAPGFFSAFASPRKASKAQDGFLPGSDSLASAKPSKLGKPDDTEANNWVSSKPNAPAKKLVKKPVTTAKAGAASKDKLAAKKTLKKATEVASASPDAAKKAATVKPASKPAAASVKTPAATDKCKPGADGKVPAGCKAAAAAPAKPKVKPAGETAAN